MLDSVITQARNKQIALFAAYAVGQLQALHADHRVYLEHPNIRQFLPADEVRRGREDGQAWLAEVEARQAQNLPEYLARRGSVAKTAAARRPDVMTPEERQRLAEGLATLKANGTPMYDRLIRWCREGGDEDPAWLLALAKAEASFTSPCPNCGHQRRADALITEVQDRVLDQLLDESGQAAQ